jgi:hypothetical protein
VWQRVVIISGPGAEPLAGCRGLVPDWGAGLGPAWVVGEAHIGVLIPSNKSS